MSSIPNPSNLSFVSDLNHLKDIRNMKARVIRKWKLPYKLELILIDEKGSKIQACIKNHLISVFEKQLCEDDVVILCKFGVGGNKDMYTVNVLPSLQIRFKVQVRVQDETGSVSFVIFDREVSKIVGSQAADIRERQVKANETECFAHEMWRLVEKKLDFKIEVSDYNLQKEYRVYTVNKIYDVLA